MGVYLLNGLLLNWCLRCYRNKIFANALWRIQHGGLSVFYLIEICLAVFVVVVCKFSVDFLKENMADPIWRT